VIAHQGHDGLDVERIPVEADVGLGRIGDESAAGVGVRDQHVVGRRLGVDQVESRSEQGDLLAVLAIDPGVPAVAAGDIDEDSLAGLQVDDQREVGCRRRRDVHLEADGLRLRTSGSRAP